MNGRFLYALLRGSLPSIFFFWGAYVSRLDGQTILWTGSADGTSWNNTGNWNPTTVPGVNDVASFTNTGNIINFTTTATSVETISLGGSGTGVLLNFYEGPNVTIGNGVGTGIIFAAGHTTSSAQFTVTGGTLYITNHASIGSGGTSADAINFVLQPGTLQFDSTVTVNPDVDCFLVLESGSTFTTASNAITGLQSTSSSDKIQLGGQLLIDFIVGGSNDWGIAGLVTDNGSSGSLALNGGSVAGTISLTNVNNTYSGGTTIGVGSSSDFPTLEIPSGGCVGSGEISLNAGFLTATGLVTIGAPVSVVASSTITSTSDPGAALIISGTLTGAGGHTLYTSGTVWLNTIEVDTGTFTVNGVITGTGLLAKTGAGTLVLVSENLYTGGTRIDQGTLVVSEAQNFGGGTAGIILNGGTLCAAGTVNSSGIITIANNSSIVVTGVALTSSGTIHGTGGTTLSGSGTVNLLYITVDSGTFTASIPISGGQLTKTGAGTLSLGTVNTYSIGTYIYDGYVADCTGNSFSTGVVTLIGGGIVGIGSLTNGNTISLAAAQGTIASTTGTYTLNGTINGTGALGIAGTGTVALQGTTSYTGGTNIVGGMLQVSAAGKLGAGVVTLNGGGLAANGSFTDTYAITLGGSGGTISTNGTYTLSGTISGSGAFATGGTGTVLLKGANTFTGGVTVSGGTLSVGAGSSIPSVNNLTIGSSGSFAINQATTNQTVADFSGSSGALVNLGSKTLTVGTSTPATTYSGLISGAGGALVKEGSGALVLTSANTYTGGTTLANGSIVVTAAGAFGSGTITLNGGELHANGTFTDTNPVVLASSGTINSLSGTYTLSGVITGAGNLLVTGVGTLGIAGASAYTGSTTISAGALAIVAGGSLPATTSLTIGPSSVFDISNKSGGQTIGDLNGTASSSQINLGGQTLTTGTSSSTTFAGVISGSGGLTKVGAGTLTLSGSNTYTGGTTVSAGHLAVNNASLQGNFLASSGGTLVYTDTSNYTYSNTFSGSGSVILNPSGKLTLSGSSTSFSGNTTINIGTVALSGVLLGTTTNYGTVQGTGTFGTFVNGSGGVLSPGNSIGTMSGTSFTFASGSTLVEELDALGNTDLVQATSSVTIDSGAALQVVPLSYSSSFTTGTKYVFIEAPTITGEFTTVTTTSPSFNFSLEYSSNQVALVVGIVPFSHLLTLAGLYPYNVAVTAAYIDDLIIENYPDYLISIGEVATGDDMYYVFDTLLAMSGQPLINALNQIHSSIYNGAKLASEAASSLVVSSIVDRLNYRKTYTCTPKGEEKYTLWATPLGEWTRQNSDFSYAGYHTDLYGGLLGLDKRVHKNIVAGASVGYAYTAIDWKDISHSFGHMNNLYVNGYTRLFNNYLYLNFLVTGTVNWNKVHRKIAFSSKAGFVDRIARGKNVGISVNEHLDVGGNWQVGRFNINPSFGADCLYIHEGKVREKGADSINLTVSANHTLVNRLEGGILISRCLLERIIPCVGVSLAKEWRLSNGKYLNTRFSAANGNISIKGWNCSRFLILPKGMLSAVWLKDGSLSTTVSYQGAFAHRYFDQSALLQVGYTF